MKTKRFIYAVILGLVILTKIIYDLAIHISNT